MYIYIVYVLISCAFLKFIYLFLAVLGLRFCARASSSCGKRGPLLIAVRGPLTIAAPLRRSTGSRRAGSVVVAHGPSCSAACGILPDQGSNPCPLHWQADPQPLRHQGSPSCAFLNIEKFQKVGEVKQKGRGEAEVVLGHCIEGRICLGGSQTVLLNS